MPIDENHPPQIESTNNYVVNFFHGTTLGQCWDIFTSQYEVGRYRDGTRNHPSGVYGTDHPGHSYDRTRLKRGYSFSRGESACCWDAPVALRWRIPRRNLKAVGLLATGSVFCKRIKPRTRIDFLAQGPDWPWECQVWIHVRIYRRFRLLPNVWKHLEDGTFVVCRAPKRNPRVVFRSGDASPMTCARIELSSEATAVGWTVANDSRQWICPNCSRMYAQQKPCTESYQFEHRNSFLLLDFRRRPR